MSIAEHAQVPAAWYPDHTNPDQLRWWTGEKWTEDVRPMIAAVPKLEELSQVAAPVAVPALTTDQVSKARHAGSEPEVVHDLGFSQLQVSELPAAEAQASAPVREGEIGRHLADVQRAPIYDLPGSEPLVQSAPALRLAPAQPTDDLDPFNVPEEQLRAWAPPVLDHLSNLSALDDTSTVWSLDAADAEVEGELAGLESIAAAEPTESTVDAEPVPAAQWTVPSEWDRPSDFELSDEEKLLPVAAVRAAEPVAVVQTVAPEAVAPEAVTPEQPAAAVAQNGQSAVALTRRQLRELVGPLVVADHANAS